MLLNPENKPLVTIEYCVPWDYVPQAASLAEILMNEFSWDISGIQLIPGTEGAFEITFDGDLIYSIKQQNGMDLLLEENKYKMTYITISINLKKMDLQINSFYYTVPTDQQKQAPLKK